MRSVFVGATALAVVLVPPVHAQSPRDSAFDARVAAIMEHWGAPGAVITIVRGGDVLLQKGYGTTRVEGGAPVTPRTLVSVASVTKTVTSVTVGMLVEEGRVGWDDPVKRHIPEFRFADDYRTENTTVRDLLTHRAGLPQILGGLRSMDYTMADLLADLPGADPRMPLRDHLDYSQVGPALLAEVVARASGMTWPEFVQARVIDPLGMTSSYPSTSAFLRTNPDPSAVPQLMGRAVRRDGRVVDGAWVGAGEVYAPAGGLVTTGEDMARFLRSLLDGDVAEGRRILSAETLATLHTPQMIEGTPYAAVVNPTAKLIGYSMFWIAHDLDGHLVVEHPGSNFGSSTVALVPDAGIGVFVSSNANYSLDSDAMVSALKLTALEYALGLGGRDWIPAFGG